MKICVYGAGAIGGWLGVKLAQAGHPVSVVARGATLAALREHGLRLQAPEGPLQATVGVSDQPGDLGPQDLVILAVKAPAMPDVARAIGPLLAPQTLVLSAMNGIPWWFFHGFGGPFEGTRLAAVDPDGAIAAAIAPARAIGCVVHAGASTPSPGFTRLQSGSRLIIGEPAGGLTPRVAALADLFAQAGVETQQSARIQQDIWFKLWGNMTLNPVSAITGATTDRILGDPLVRDFISRVMREAQAVGDRLGLPVDQTPEDRHRITLRLGAFKTSMLQDVEARKPVELDALLAAARELGALAGIDMPCADALLGLARLRCQMLGLYET